MENNLDKCVDEVKDIIKKGSNSNTKPTQSNIPEFGKPVILKHSLNGGNNMRYDNKDEE
jgi:hypothetical protein